jgi:streptogramin lyase
MRIVCLLFGCALAASAQQAANGDFILKGLQSAAVGSDPTVITEFPLPSADSNLGAITPGPDGALWFTERSGNKIGRITTAGVITEFPLSSQPIWIAAGPDDALWFTERAVPYDKIGRITTVGVITEFPLPTAATGHMRSPLVQTAPSGSQSNSSIGLDASPQSASLLTSPVSLAKHRKGLSLAQTAPFGSQR